jgi:prevent-host-death family protein
MRCVGAREARARLSELLDRVVEGESITIARHGVPVATLDRVGAAHARPVREVIDDLVRFRRGNRLDGLTTDELVDGGRR